MTEYIIYLGGDKMDGIIQRETDDHKKSKQKEKSSARLSPFSLLHKDMVTIPAKDLKSHCTQKTGQQHIEFLYDQESHYQYQGQQ